MLEMSVPKCHDNGHGLLETKHKVFEFSEHRVGNEFLAGLGNHYTKLVGFVTYHFSVNVDELSIYPLGSVGLPIS